MATTPSVDTPTTSSPAITPTVSKKSNPLLILAIAFGALLLLAGGAAAGYLFFSRNATDDSTDTDQIDSDDTADAGDHTDTDDQANTDEDSDADANADEEADDPYAGWHTFSNSDINISFSYPTGWSVTDGCQSHSVSSSCTVTAEIDRYQWILDVDPLVTGGGFGFLFDGMLPATSTETSAVSPAGDAKLMVTQYVSTAAITTAAPEFVFAQQGEVWGWSVLAESSTAPYTIGFGPGEMYDNTDANFFGIFYRYDATASGGSPDYTLLPLQGSAGLEDMLATMDLITNSVELE